MENSIYWKSVYIAVCVTIKSQTYTKMTGKRMHLVVQLVRRPLLYFWHYQELLFSVYNRHLCLINDRALDNDAVVRKWGVLMVNNTVR